MKVEVLPWKTPPSLTLNEAQWLWQHLGILSLEGEHSSLPCVVCSPPTPTEGQSALPALLGRLFTAQPLAGRVRVKLDDGGEGRGLLYHIISGTINRVQVITYSWTCALFTRTGWQGNSGTLMNDTTNVPKRKETEFCCCCTLNLSIASQDHSRSVKQTWILLLKDQPSEHHYPAGSGMPLADTQHIKSFCLGNTCTICCMIPVSAHTHGHCQTQQAAPLCMAMEAQCQPKGISLALCKPSGIQSNGLP